MADSKKLSELTEVTTKPESSDVMLINHMGSSGVTESQQIKISTLQEAFGVKNTSGTTDPTTSTSAEKVGQIYVNTTTGFTFICTSIANGVYTWKQVSSPEMTGASSSSNGVSGTVPAPKTTDVNKFLAGNGSWSNITTDVLSNGSNDFIIDCGTSII